MGIVVLESAIYRPLVPYWDCRRRRDATSLHPIRGRKAPDGINQSDSGLTASDRPRDPTRFLISQTKKKKKDVKLLGVPKMGQLSESETFPEGLRKK